LLKARATTHEEPPEVSLLFPCKTIFTDWFLGSYRPVQAFSFYTVAA